MRKNTLWKILHTKIYKNLVKISTNFANFANVILKGRPIDGHWKCLKSTLQKNAKNDDFQPKFEVPKTTNTDFHWFLSIFGPFLSQKCHFHYRFESLFWQSALFRWYFRRKYSFLGVAPMKTAQLTRFSPENRPFWAIFSHFRGLPPQRVRLGLGFGPF